MVGKELLRVEAEMRRRPLPTGVAFFGKGWGRGRGSEKDCRG